MQEGAQMAAWIFADGEEDFADGRGIRRGLKLVRYSDWSRS